MTNIENVQPLACLIFATTGLHRHIEATSIVCNPAFPTDAINVINWAPYCTHNVQCTSQEACESRSRSCGHRLDQWFPCCAHSINTCERCNRDEHICPGCGANVEHGMVACTDCANI